MNQNMKGFAEIMGVLRSQAVAAGTGNRLDSKRSPRRRGVAVSFFASREQRA
jgi:hypothetical protein